MIWLILEGFLILFIELVVLLFVLVFVEKKKPFIYTKNLYKYNLYTFIRNYILQCAFDIAHRDPDTFPYTGIYIYEGTQGRGKTMCMVYDTLKMLHDYPKCILLDNLGISAEGINNTHYNLEHWKQILDINNGKYGNITIIDETQLWWSSKESSKLDPNVLTILCQNRKNRRIILGSCQKFYLMAKDLRMQCTELRSAFHIGPIMGYIRKEPLLDTSGELSRVRFKGIKIFLQSQELRDSYDTFKILQRLSATGFADPKDNILRGN